MEFRDGQDGRDGSDKRGVPDLVVNEVCGFVIEMIYTDQEVQMHNRYTQMHHNLGNNEDIIIASGWCHRHGQYLLLLM